MKISSLLFGAFLAVVVISVFLWVTGVNFHRPMSAQGAALYNAANEVVVDGLVQAVQEFDCPVSEGELGSHLMLKTADGVVQVHLAPVRIMTGQKLRFAPGDQIEVVGAKIRLNGKNGVIALSESNLSSVGKVSDVAMLVLTGGKERTFREYQDLLTGAGFRINRAFPTPADFVVIEAMPT